MCDEYEGCNCEKCVGIRNSDAVVLVFTPGTSVSSMDTTVLGLAVSLDKPIVLICPPGCKVPEKLAKVVDRFLEMGPDADREQMAQAVKEALLELGVFADRGRPPYGTEPSHN